MSCTATMSRQKAGEQDRQLPARIRINLDAGKDIERHCRKSGHIHSTKRSGAHS